MARIWAKLVNGALRVNGRWGRLRKVAAKKISCIIMVVGDISYNVYEKSQTSKRGIGGYLMTFQYYNRKIVSKSIPGTNSHAPPLGPLWPLARFTVARPLASPTPRPRVPLDRNMGAFLKIQ